MNFSPKGAQSIPSLGNAKSSDPILLLLYRSEDRAKNNLPCMVWANPSGKLPSPETFLTELVM
jgi:hypothetical protein